MQAISKAKIKLFTSLRTKKYRYRHQMFLIEGKKLVEEALRSDWDLAAVLLRADMEVWWRTHHEDKEAYLVDDPSFKQMSTHQQSEGILGVVQFPHAQFCKPMVLDTLMPGQGFILDGLQDPGNVGTLMRSLDWFGIKELILGPGCVDPLNPKCLRSSMGAVFRMNLTILSDWGDLLDRNKERIYLADMNGKAVQDEGLNPETFVLIGNEAQGISEFVREKNLPVVSIPRIGKSESLNAGVAASLFAWEMAKSRL